MKGAHRKNMMNADEDALIGSNKEIRQKLRAEFATLIIDDPEHFAGGCKKSKKVPGWCCGFNNSGAIGKLHCTCRNYAQCSGEHMQYNP